MNNEGVDRQRQKLNEFVLLLPLTTVIAGLSRAEAGRGFNEGQLDARSTTIRTAYRLACQLYPDVSKLMQLLPLAAELAGLAHAEHGKHFNEGQMEVRANSLRAAFKAAHQIAVAVAREGTSGN
jgi:predicted transcriptional regulator